MFRIEITDRDSVTNSMDPKIRTYINSCKTPRILLRKSIGVRHIILGIFTYTIVWMFSDTETDMLEGYPSSAICVQGSDDSRNSAIRIAYRTLLRSSSVWEPRHPSLKIFYLSFYYELGYYQKLVYSRNI